MCCGAFATWGGRSAKTGKRELGSKWVQCGFRQAGSVTAVKVGRLLFRLVPGGMAYRNTHRSRCVRDGSARRRSATDRSRETVNGKERELVRRCFGARRENKLSSWSAINPACQARPPFPPQDPSGAEPGWWRLEDDNNQASVLDNQRGANAWAAQLPARSGGFPLCYTVRSQAAAASTPSCMGCRRMSGLGQAGFRRS